MSVEFTDEQFAAVFRVLPVMAHSIDREGRLVHVSDAWLERLKYERDDVIGRPLTDFLTEEGRNRATGEVIPRFFREGRVDDIPYAFVASDGEIVDILLSARAVSLPDQRVGALGVLIDVTRQRESEREAFRDRHLLERFFAALPDAAVLTDTERRLVRVSAATKTIFGYEPEELLGKTTEVFYPSSDAYSAQGQRRYNAHADPTLTTYRSRYKRADGSLFEAETVGGPLYDDKGRHVGNLGIMRNIEPQLAAERARDALEAEVAQRQKLESLGMLASGIAHDFNNLLVPILGNASVMRLQLDKDGMQDELLDDIVQSATQAGALCRQLLAYAGKDQMVTEVVSLPELVSSLAPLFRSTLPVTCELVREGDDVDTPVRADPSQLQQVAMNLILNAADALGGAPGTVVVRTGVTSFDPDAVTTPVLGSDLAAGRYASLEVEDTGCGMSPETIAHIFDPFFTTKQTGRGLGLAAVIGIVRAHDGARTVHSTPGKGSRFRLLLPLAEQPQPVAAPQEIASAPTSAGIALVADDEPAVRRVVSRLLEAAGYEVLIAEDGVQAEALAREQGAPPTIALLDVTMPHRGGVETREALRRLWPELPIVLMSGYSEVAIPPRLEGERASTFLHKPFGLADLRRALAEALGD